jgi:hypothetical protein
VIPPTPRSIQRTHLLLLLGNTLAASLIWGINTIFLLDAGLSNLQAFAANAFFTAGMVLFEVPMGIVADTVGRRSSYLLGTPAGSTSRRWSGSGSDFSYTLQPALVVAIYPLIGGSHAGSAK